MFAGAMSRTIQCLHQVGQVVQHIMDSSAYGEGAVERLAKDVQVSPVMLYRYAELFRSFSLQDIAEAQRRAENTGYALSPSMVLEIASVSDRNERLAMLAQVIEQRSTVQRFRRERRTKAISTRELKRSGNPLSVATATVRAFAAQFKRLVEQDASECVDVVSRIGL